MQPSEIAALLQRRRLPAVAVDLDAFDRNVAKVVEMVRPSNKTMRLATKSLRVPELIARALKLSQGVFQGLMCYAVEEAVFLRAQGFDDLMVAYPTVQESDLQALRELHDGGARVTIVVDHPEQVARLAEAMRGVARPFAVLLDIDVSLRFLGGLLHLGVRRSRLRTQQDALGLCDEIARYRGVLECAGLMAYEAQVAGLGDRNPFKRFFNPIAGLVRRLSLPRVARLRAEIAQALRSRGLPIRIINGAGTGSLNWALAETSLTEVTIGSALLSPHLFDYYSNIRFEPACYFALQASRTSDDGYVTCLGGGYVASGSPGWDHLPKPLSAALLPDEGTGEVQTPLRLPAGAGQPRLGAAMLFRHAKAGELAERFDEYCLVSKGAVVGTAKTYRGLGQCFF